MKLQRIFLRQEPDGEIVEIWGRVCWRCRIWFATPYAGDDWICPSCKDKKREPKRWPNARIIENRGNKA